MLKKGWIAQEGLGKGLPAPISYDFCKAWHSQVRGASFVRRGHLDQGWSALMHPSMCRRGCRGGTHRVSLGTLLRKT